MEISDRLGTIISTFFKIMVAEHVTRHSYSWTSVTEMAKWSTTGFSLQCQSVMNQASDRMRITTIKSTGRYIMLMYQQMVRTLMWREMIKGHAVKENWKWWRYEVCACNYIYSFTRLNKKLKLKLASQTMSSEILLALGKSWFSYFEFLISGRMTS